MALVVTLNSIRQHLRHRKKLEDDARHARLLATQQHKLALLLCFLSQSALPAELARLELAAQRLERDATPSEASLHAFVEIKDVRLALQLRRMQNLYHHYMARSLLPYPETADYLSVLPQESVLALRSFISLLISPSSLPTIARSLISQQGQAFAGLGSRLASFLLLLYHSRGREALADFAETLLTDCVQELEAGSADAARTKETETIIVDLFETLRSLDVSIAVSLPNSPQVGSAGRGPFEWGTGADLVLLELLREGRRILNKAQVPVAVDTVTPSLAPRSPKRGHAMSQSISSMGEGAFKHCFSEHP
jgi:hypothetical protein